MDRHPFESLTQWFPNDCDLDAIEKMYRHWQLMLQWNARTNLTAIKTDSDALLKHYADSVVMVESLPSSGRVLDVGSGGGFPGIPLAIIRPNLQWILLEPRQKRVSFLRAVIARLGLSNVEVVQGRSDEEPTTRCDVAVTRATFSDVADATTVLSWLEDGGCLYALRSIDAPAWDGATTHIVNFADHVRRIDRLL